MKKQRGLRRYYKNLKLRNDFTQLRWLDINEPSTWKPNFHIHFDHCGYGNSSFNRRKPHLDKLFRHFDWLSKSLKLTNSGYQLYAIILDFDSSSDALFLHQPDAGNSQFEFKISELSTKTTLMNHLLNHYIRTLGHYEKLYGKAGESFCLLFKKDKGKGL